MSKISQQDIEALVEVFERSGWRELRVVGEGVDLFVSKDPGARRTKVRKGPAATVPAQPRESVAPAAEPAAALPPTSPQASVPAHWVAVRAPCLGTFYLAPKPGAPVFVSIGQRVTRDTEICLIEVMKLFTTVRAGVTGTVRKVLIADAELVEYDQPLFYVEPDA